MLLTGVPLLALAKDQGDAVAFVPFIVYRDNASPNRYISSGYMPTGECIKQDNAYTQNCAEGKSCIKVVYDTACSAKSRRWAGVYWLNPADNWGERKGGYDLNGARKLVFWAKGEKGGEEIADFKIGRGAPSREFPDTDSASIGPVILSKDWREYSIDLRGKGFSSIIGGFAWVARGGGNPGSCAFFLDNIRFA